MGGRQVWSGGYRVAARLKGGAWPRPLPMQHGLEAAAPASEAAISASWKTSIRLHQGSAAGAGGGKGFSGGRLCRLPLGTYVVSAELQPPSSLVQCCTSLPSCTCRLMLIDCSTAAARRPLAQERHIFFVRVTRPLHLLISWPKGSIKVNLAFPPVGGVLRHPPTLRPAEGPLDQ